MYGAGSYQDRRDNSLEPNSCQLHTSPPPPPSQRAFFPSHHMKAGLPKHVSNAKPDHIKGRARARHFGATPEDQEVFFPHPELHDQWHREKICKACTFTSTSFSCACTCGNQPCEIGQIRDLIHFEPRCPPNRHECAYKRSRPPPVASQL